MRQVFNTDPRRSFPRVRILRGTIFAILLLLFGSFTLPGRKAHVFLIGDSTMADKELTAYPETGWGTPFQVFFDSSLVVENHARNGRSTRSFLAEGSWTTVYEKLCEGDYVIIQFGHNDEAKNKKERYTTPEQYKDNLRLFVRETREKGAQPILLTPVSRRRFDENGLVMETHPEYSPLVREVAGELTVPFIDADSLSRRLYQEYGPEYSKLLFLHLQPGDHPNYPLGEEDNTHYNELGARLIAQIILKEIMRLDLGLTGYIRNYSEMTK